MSIFFIFSLVPQSHVKKSIGAAKLIRESVVEQVKSKDGSVVLEFVKLDGFKWFFGDNIEVLYSRFPHSKNIYNKIKSSYDYHTRKSINQPSSTKKTSRCLIIGQPGIGKSVSLNVYIRMAVIDGIDVLVETRSDRYYISKDSDDILHEPLGKMELIDHRERPDVLIFHDHQPKMEPPILNNEGFLVAAVSPDVNSFHEFIKQRPLQIWMPSPTLAEILAMNTLSTPRSSDEIIISRVETVGPVIRYVLSDDDEYNKRVCDMENIAESFELSNAIVNFLRTGYVPKGRDGMMSWKLFLVDGVIDYRAPSIVKWISNDIRDIALMSSRSLELKDIERYLLATLGNPKVLEQPTAFYEYWVFRKLASGGMVLKPTSCVTNKPTEEIGPTTFLSVKDLYTMPLTNRVLTIEDLKDKVSKLFHPLKKGNHHVDAAALIKNGEGKFELLLFQATVGLKHKDISLHKDNEENDKNNEVKDKNNETMKFTIINKAKKKHKDIVSIRFIFIVPFLNKFTLTSEQKSSRSDGVSVEIAEMRPHSSDV